MIGRGALAMVSVAAALGLAAGARAATSGPLACVQQQRTTLTACLSQSRDQCNAAFQAAVPPCFGSAAPCATGCEAGQTQCSAGPTSARDGCEQACGASEKTVLAGCKKHPAAKRCQLVAKFRALKCRQKCVRNVNAALQACAQAFDDCLKSCAAGG
ncbi:MAG TPA: hypothetical protein VKW76_10570 [Candidatus Binatia bacterium]|nr:hypothetical protein [Candidatus Binatia bacterium]